MIVAAPQYGNYVDSHNNAIGFGYDERFSKILKFPDVARPIIARKFSDSSSVEGEMLAIALAVEVKIVLH